jgi:hypothetical protein
MELLVIWLPAHSVCKLTDYKINRYLPVTLLV